MPAFSFGLCQNFSVSCKLALKVSLLGGVFEFSSIIVHHSGYVLFPGIQSHLATKILLVISILLGFSLSPLLWRDLGKEKGDCHSIGGNFVMKPPLFHLLGNDVQLQHLVPNSVIQQFSY